MIWIPRKRTDDEGRPIQPDQQWFDASAEATAQARQEARDHEVSDLYKTDQVRAALEELFYRKCAYCEASIANQSWDVEHYRPKGRVAERPDDHPGYYWLAYEWSNLYPACTFCNQRRKDKPLWGDQRVADTAGKFDQFPLEDEAKRVMDPTDDVTEERPLLFDPCLSTDRHEERLRYGVQGEIYPVPNDQGATATIAICHLHRRRLRDLRRAKIEMTVSLLESIEKARSRGETALVSDLEAFVDRRLCADSCEHAGATRFVRRDPAAFGL